MSDGLIQATSRTVKTMADGTLRLTIDIEPGDAQGAFMLFGQPGAPVVLARLTQEAAQASLQKQIAEPEMKGGELAKWAGILCNDEQFHKWIDATVEDSYQYVTNGTIQDDAKNFIAVTCGITSRRELDHNKQAGLTFREEIMAPFHEWREEQK